MKILAQLMVVGVNGVHGQTVLSAVEEELKGDLDCVIVQHLNSAVRTVQWTVLLI